VGLPAKAYEGSLNETLLKTIKMDFSTINWLAILVAAVASFAVGSVWYAKPVFGGTWQKLINRSDEDIRNASMVKIFGLAFLLTLVMAINLAMFIGEGQGFAFGLFAGAAAGIGWVAMGIGVMYLYEDRPFRLWLINAGYMALALSVMDACINNPQIAFFAIYPYIWVKSFLNESKHIKGPGHGIPDVPGSFIL
jgi:hypothetical protein